MTDAQLIPEAPECAPMCDGHPDADHGRWDVVCENRTGVEAVMWCRRTTAEIPTRAGGPAVVAERCVSWNSAEPGAVEVDRGVVRLEPFELTLDQAEQLAAALLEAARLAR